MKKLYKMTGLLILVTLLIAGCSTNNSTEKTPVEPDNVVVENNDKEEVPEENELPVDSEKDDVTSKVLVDLMNAKEYTMEIKQTITFKDFKTTTLFTTVVVDDNTYTYSDTDGNTIEFMEKDDNFYMIMHDSKTIIKSDRYEDDETENTNVSIIYDDLEFVSKGKENFLGNNRNYEEYKVDSGLVKYYFDGDKLDGMSMIIDMESLLEDDYEDENEEEIVTGEATVIMEVLSYDKSADMTVFELPEDYEIFGD